MTVLRPRARSISVRLSLEEFSALERFCVASGARSISELARNAICSLLNHANQENALTSTVREHSALVRNMEDKINQLTAEIGLLKAKKRSKAINMTEGGQKISDEIAGEN
jgi:DNA anti-recombination protein RmuC